MKRKNAALLLTFALTLQSVVGAFAGEVPEAVLQAQEEYVEFSADDFATDVEEPDNSELLIEAAGLNAEDLVGNDVAADEESEVHSEEFFFSEFLSDEAEIIETGLTEEELPDEQSFLTEDESFSELIEEDAPVIGYDDDDDDDDDYDDDDDNNAEYIQVEYGGSAILELPASLADGVSGINWHKYVYEPYIDDYGNLRDSAEKTDENLASLTSTVLQLNNITESAVYVINWTTADSEYKTRWFFVTVNNGFQTFSPDANRDFSMELGETVTLRIDVRANDMTGMKYVWFGGVNMSDYQKLEATGNSCTLTASERPMHYLCYVIDKYLNCDTLSFFVSVTNLVQIGNQITDIALSPNQTYTMSPSVKTLDNTDDQLTYEWDLDGESLEGVNSSSYTPPHISDEDYYCCRVTDHLGNYLDIYWEFYVLEPGDQLVLYYEENYQVPYGSDVALEVSAASGDTSTPITYQWYSRTYDPHTDEAEDTLLSGKNQPALVLTQLQERGCYVCKVSQGTVSKEAEIYVSVESKLKADLPFNGGNSAFVVVPDSQGNALLSVNASTDQDHLDYSWERNDKYAVLAEGVSSITVSDPGYYVAKVSDGISREDVRFLVGHPVAGSTDMETAPTLSSGDSIMLNHTVDSTVYVKLNGKGIVQYRSTCNCEVSLITEDEYEIDYYEEFGEEGIEYNPETDGSPVYLAITTDDEIGFEGAFTLVSFDEEGSGSYDGPVWGDWYVYKEPTCTSAGIMRRNSLYGDGAFEEKIFGAALGHSFGSETVTPATALAPGRTTRTCSRCGEVLTGVVPQLTAHLTLNASGTVPLQVKKSSAAIEAVSMADGDYLKSAESSNKKLGLTVSVSGKTVKIRAGKKTGKSVITVKTAGGASASFKIKVQKAKVVAKKAADFPKRLTLTKGQVYTLKPVITPITTPDKLKYSSSAKKVAAVSKAGVITAKNKGKAVVTLKVGNKSFKCNVKVK